jgi:hypothetical protein
MGKVESQEFCLEIESGRKVEVLIPRPRQCDGPPGSCLVTSDDVVFCAEVVSTGISARHQASTDLLVITSYFNDMGPFFI